MLLFSLLLCSVFLGTPYIIYTRERFFIICFQDGDFYAKDSFFRLVFFFSNMLHDGFRHADGFSFSFVLIQKKRKRKEKIKATSPGLLRRRSQSFFSRQGASLLAFCFGFALPSAFII